MINKVLQAKFPYAFEEFAGHLRAMKMVRQWEFTCRFGYLGQAQTSAANTSRVIEYFADSYRNASEALYKAEVFLFISDYLARHEAVFAEDDLMEREEDGSISVERALLAAVHQEFIAPDRKGDPDPQQIRKTLLNKG